MPNYQVTHHKCYSKIAFDAMASPCEILIRSLDPDFCHRIAKLVVEEAKRIETKYSRYIPQNLVDQMNNSCGQSVTIDQETFQLLEYARNLFELSDGLFDITSGVLRKIWTLTPNSTPPRKYQIERLLEKIGFDSINYSQTSFCMPEGMQIDFGGIGKEYAVDQVTQILNTHCQQQRLSFLVNFGGDLSALKFKQADPPWIVGLESANDKNQTESLISLASGSVATSGNTKRFLEYQGKLYGHLLNPKTGYPVEGAPRSITVFSDNCVLAGSLSSLAMLQGNQAEDFLKSQSIRYICIW
jgi:thiamine biosynthesis lipoprotein